MAPSLKWFGSLVAAGLAAALIVKFIAAESRARDLTRAIELLRADVEAVKRRPATPKLVIRELPPAAATASSLSAPAVAALDETDAERGEGGPKQEPQGTTVSPEERVATCGKTYDEEPVDSTWARSAESALVTTYSPDNFADLNLKSSCRTTLCRVEFNYSDAAAGNAALTRMLLVQPWPGKQLRQHDHGTQSGVIYIAREGFTLPHEQLAALHE